LIQKDFNKVLENNWNRRTRASTSKVYCL